MDTVNPDSLDAEGKALREAADNAGFTSMTADEPEEQVTETPVADKPADNSDTEADKDKGEQVTGERARDEQGRFVKKEGEEPADELPGTDSKSQAEPKDKAPASADSKPESNYAKATKERERQDRSWAKLNEEKAAVAAEKAAIESLKRDLQQRQADPRPRDEQGRELYSSQEYRDAAKHYRQLARKGEVGPNGEDYFYLAEKADLAAQNAATAEARQHQDRFEQHQSRMALEVMQREPDLADVNSPLAKEVQTVFSEELARSQKHQRPSIFKLVPDGFELAVEVAKLRREAASASELKAKIQTMEAELSKLRKATSLSSSSPTRQPQPKAFADMNAEEMSTALRRAAEREDATAGV